MISTLRHVFTSLITTAAVGLLAPTASEAAQFKTLNTSSLTASTPLQAHSSPGSTAGLMDMEMYEFFTREQAGYQCHIHNNATRISLNLRMLAATGAELRACVAPPGGSCSTPLVTLFAAVNLICLVAPAEGGSAGAAAHYLFGLSLHPTPRSTAAARREQSATTTDLSAAGLD